MVKKNLSILTLIAIIFHGATLTPLMALSVGEECRQYSDNVCQCGVPQEIQYEQMYPEGESSCSSSCTCFEKRSKTTPPCCLAFSYSYFSKNQVKKIAILSPKNIPVLPAIYHSLEYPLFFIKPRLHISGVQKRAPPLYLPALNFHKEKCN